MQQPSNLFLSALLIGQLAAFPVRAQQPSYDTLVVHFLFNQSTLRQEDTSRLTRFLDKQTADSDTLLLIGYADTTGAARYNKHLSFSRAQATARYIERSFPGRVLISARGEEEPIDGGDSLNRRVLVVARRVVRYIAESRDTIIVLTDINFVEDTPIPTGSSRMALPAYVRMLRQYKADHLEIDGYCNSYSPITSTADPLFQLSVKRAKFIYDYLVDEGFDPAKLSYKGMGNAAARNSRPATPDEARANMRVEVRIFYRQLH